MAMRILRTSLAAAAALGLGGLAQAEPVAVQFHADWCGKCEALEPKLADADDAFGAAGIVFVRLDFTDRSEAARMAQLDKAEAAGLLAIYEAHAPGTGFVLLVDDESGETLGKITADMTVGEIEAKAAALAAAG